MSKTKQSPADVPTTEAPATEALAISEWETNFRAALAGVVKVRYLTNYRPFWASLGRFCAAFCNRPMPAKFLPLERIVFEILRDALAPAFAQACEDQQPLQFLEAYLVHAATRLDLLLARLHQINNPRPPRPRETVAQLLAMEPRISAAQLVRMSGPRTC